MIDDLFVKRFRKWVLKYNTLHDCAFKTKEGNLVRATNFELERFRNDPKLTFVERHEEGITYPHKVYRGSYWLRKRDILHHLAFWGDASVYMTNSAKTDVLLMLVDIDNKDGHGDAAAAARHLSERYFDGHTWVDLSTYGKGRHVYFLVNVGMFKRLDVRLGFEKFAEVIGRDHQFQDYGCKFDGFYGLPTIWLKDDEGRWWIEQRGDNLKLPFCRDDDADLDLLGNLRVLNYGVLDDFLKGSRTGVSALSPSTSVPNPLLDEDDVGVTTPPSLQIGVAIDPAKANHPDGGVRRAHCASIVMIRTNGEGTEDDMLTLYHAQFTYTGTSQRDIQKRRQEFKRLRHKFLTTFRPAKPNHDNLHAHGFRTGQYLDLVRQLVPETAFKWGRREKLDHQRLADFVGVKVQDAFFKKNNGYFGATSRDATINNFRALRKKGLVDWTINSHVYTKLLGLARQYNLLHVYQQYRPPIRRLSGEKVAKGVARMIGPGDALPTEKAEFEVLYNEWKAKQAGSVAA